MTVYRLFLHLLRFVVFWFGGIAAALAGTRNPATPDENYVEFGEKFPFVVVLKAGDADNPAKLRVGSAVIIREHWILTAAHVVTQAQNISVVKTNNSVFPISHVVRHPEYKEDNVGYYDVALGYSPAPFDLQFYCPLYTDADEVGKAATISGFGIHGTFNTGAVAFDGKRRAGQNLIARAEKGVLICTPRKTGAFPLEFIITIGDSGGGLFIGNKLAGINSFLMAVDGKPNGSYTDEAAHTRISLYAEWIENEIEKYTAPAPPPDPTPAH
jgi:hypothetical protein